MTIAQKFEKFCKNLRMNDDVVNKISCRSKQITKRINADFWGIDSDIKYSLFVGSYGRGTDIHVSDIDMIVQLPDSEYKKYNDYIWNGQSVLLQAVKNSIQKTYSTTHLRADGQVIQIEFTDGVRFEIVPAFICNDNNSYSYPDTNNGGSWETTKPRQEIAEMNRSNKEWNKNLKRLCRMARAWKDTWRVPIGGLLIDTLAYNFLNHWKHKDKSFLYYDYMTRDFFEYLSNQDSNKKYWLAVGSNQYVLRVGNFEYKAKQCYNLALKAIEYEEENMTYSADKKWREIYGTKFPQQSIGSTNQGMLRSNSVYS